MQSNHPNIVESNRGYTSLLCYKKSVVIYDLTFHFCSRFIDVRDRTHDQMIQAARSGKQNIVEGYVDKATSFEMALKLYNVARASLAELREDYLDYLRARGLRIWKDDSAEKAAMRKLSIEHSDSDYFIRLAESRSDEIIANMALVLLYQTEHLLFNFIKSEEKAFVGKGGFKERMYHARVKHRGY
jgi:four helix bundle suffix protein